MSRLRSKRTVVIAMAAVVAVVALWLFSGDRLSREARENFEWFSTLGFPDVKGCPYVKIATGDTSTNDDGTATNDYFKGFLLATNGTTFKVLKPNLTIETFTNTGPTAQEFERVGYERLDLKKECQALVAKMQSHSETNEQEVRDLFGNGTLSLEAQVFALAWACHRQGLKTEANQLYKWAADYEQPSPPRKSHYAWRNTKAQFETMYDSLRERFWKKSDDNPRSSFHDNLNDEFVRFAFRLTLEDFADPSVSRPAFAARLEVFIKKYPGTEERTNATALVETLRGMIAEDRIHPKLTEAEIEKLPVEAQVKELIFQLRDEARTLPQWPWAAIFNDDEELFSHPTRRLIKLGYAAVPQLIAAADSNSVSRAGSGYRHGYPPDPLMTVGDASLSILMQITGKFFHPGGSTEPPSEIALETRKKEAEAWLVEYRKKGEKQMLIEGVASGEWDAQFQAILLSERFPEAATAPLMRGIRAATDNSTRQALLKQLAETGDESAPAFLLEEMKTAPDLQTRAVAAVGLHKRGHQSEARAAMIKEWERVVAQGGVMPYDAMQVVAYLGECDSPEAVAALAAKLRERPIELRYRVIESLGETNRWLLDNEEEKLSADTLAAIEEVLVSSLDDFERVSGGIISWDNGKTYSDRRICDDAAGYLSARWPDKYSFDVNASTRTRERQRIECQNVWRKAHDQPVLPLPPVQTAIKVPRSDATKITAIEWPEGSVGPSESLKSRFAAFKGKPLRGADVIALFAELAGHPETGAAGVELVFCKEDDLTGVRAVVRLIPPGDASQAEKRVTTKVVSQTMTLIDSNGGERDLKEYADLDEWSDLEDTIDKVVGIPPDQSFEVYVRLNTGDLTEQAAPASPRKRIPID